jgi:hypothetical protein
MSFQKYKTSMRTWAENMRTAYEVSLGRGVVAHKITGFLGGDVGGVPLCVGYVGQPRFAHDFEFFLGDKKTRVVQHKETVFEHSWMSMAAQHSRLEQWMQGCDVVVVQDFFKTQHKKSAWYFSPYLRAVLPLQGSMEEQLAYVPSKSHRQRMRKISRMGFTSTHSVSLSDCVSFYNSFYKPHAQYRFGAQAHTESFEDVWGVFQRGGVLVWLCEEGVRVGCGMLVPSPAGDGSMLYYRNGFLEACKRTPLQLGDMNAALEYAVVQYGIAQGVSSIDFDLTLAYASDGVFTHKRRLGCVFEEASYSPCFEVKVQGAHALKTLQAFPLVGRLGGKLGLMLGYENVHMPEEEGWKSHMRNVLFQGVQHVRVCASKEHTHALEGMTLPHFKEVCQWEFASL